MKRPKHRKIPGLKDYRVQIFQGEKLVHTLTVDQDTEDMAISIARGLTIKGERFIITELPDNRVVYDRVV